jgi:hypothetical protein
MLNSSISSSILKSIVYGGTISSNSTPSLPTSFTPVTSIRFYTSNPFLNPTTGTISAIFTPAISVDNLYIYNTNTIQVNIISNNTLYYAGLLAADTTILLASKLSTPLTVVAGQQLSILHNEFAVSFINL